MPIIRIAVELEGMQINRDGIGSLVTIDTAGARQIRHASIGGEYASQHSTRLYFGLNTSDRVDTLTVQWPSGIKQRFDNISACQIVRVTKGQGIVT